MTIPVTVFSDYICPFCYVGSRRIDNVAAEFDLAITWANVEIHPDNPAEGKPVEELGYPPQQWQRMMAALTQMAEAEGLPIVERSFTTNSRRALLLAERAKDHDTDAFTRIHEALFHAYFAERRNIGDADVLRAIALDCGLSEADVEAAWHDPTYTERLRRNHEAAAHHQISGTPTFVIADGETLVGAVETDEIRQALRRAA